MYSRYIFAMISFSYLVSSSLIMDNNIEEHNKRNKRFDNTSHQNEDLNVTTARITTLDVTTNSNTITTNNIAGLINESNDTSDQDIDSDDTADRIVTENTTTENITTENISNLDSIIEDIFLNGGFSLDVSSNKIRAENTTSDMEHAVTANNETNVDEDKTTTVKYVETKRISERKCDEYTQVTRLQARRTFASTSNWSIKYAVAQCAQIAFIRGGTKAKNNEFPHMAAVGWKTYESTYVFSCGGSLISENFVLTAAHCTYDPNAAEPKPSVIFIGENHVDPNGEREGSYIVNIKSIHKHPDYKPPKRYNDIALLKLERHLAITLEIRPACLWHKDDFKWHSRGIATGWGLTDSGEKASDLQRVLLTLLDNDVCDPLLKKIRNRNWQGFSPTQMCAGELGGGKDTCQGDSGAPLQVSDDYCIFHVVGVTSFGHRCAEPDRPAIYTRVSKYLDWIERIVWPEEEISNT